MALPKKSKMDVSNSKNGVDRREELINLISNKSLFFPKGITIDDLDDGIYEFVNSELSINVEGKKIPTIFMTKERWSEFIKTKEIKDDKGNITMPYFTLKTDSSPKQGSNDSLRYNIAQNKKFTYAKVPSFEDGKFSVDIYQIPQPTPVDINYEFKFYTKYKEDLNRFNENLLYKFASNQCYMLVNGYYIPIKLDDTENDFSLDYDTQNFYSQAINLKVIGFLQDVKNFEVIRSLRDIKLSIDIIKNELIYKK